MDASPALGAASAVLGATFRIVEKGFEISAVDDQAKSVLKTVNQVSGQLNNATTLRRQKSSLFTKFEKRMIDETLEYTKDAISLVATLVEPARVDMEVSGGSIRFPTRLLFILRDSPRIHICLTQLGIASQSLNRDLAILCERDGRRATTAVVPEILVKPAPPPYEEVVFLTEQRQRNSRRRGSALSLPAILNRPQAASTTSISTLGIGEAAAEPDTNRWRSEAVEQNASGEAPVPNTASMPSSSSSLNLHPMAALGHGSSTEDLDRPPRIGGRQRSLRWLESRAA